MQLNKTLQLSLCCVLFLCACKTNKYSPFQKKGFVTIDNNLTKNSEISSLVKPYQNELQAKMNTVIAYCDTPMERLLKEPETLLGNLIADIVFEYAYQNNISTDMSILNFGGLRTSLPKGDITVGKIFELMPFENDVVLATLNHSTMLKLQEYLVSQKGQPISNAQITINNDGSSEFLVNNKPLHASQVYLVATTDYLASGGDKMKFFEEALEIKPLNIKLRELIIQYFKDKGNNKEPITSRIQNRVKISQ